MMAKIVKGSDFKGAVDYIIDKKKDTQIVASEGLFMENLETIAMSFNAQSRMNDKVTKPVGHIALSFSKEDELRLTNRIMAGIALEYMERMGIKNTQFFIAQHFDKEHPHVHIAFNRIDNNGNTISDRHERLRSTRICKELTLKYGLHMAGGKDNVKRNRLKEPDRTKYALYDIIKMEVGRCGNWNVLIANLKRQGVEVHFKHKGQTSEVQGVVFSMNGYHFNGSKVDRRFSYSKIDAALQHNRCRERMGITAGIYETATPSAPSGTAQSELFNGSWGLLKSSGSSYNAADAEANQEMVDILRRRKKVKRKLQQVVDELHTGVLKDLSSMSKYCWSHGGEVGNWPSNYGYIVETENYRYCLRCNPVPGDYQAYLTAFDLRVQRQNLAEQAAVIGRVTFASGEQQEYTDAETFLQCIRDELPNHPVTGFRYETLTDDPAIRKQVDDILYDLYGEENPRPLEDYENTPQEGMTMGGMT